MFGSADDGAAAGSGTGADAVLNFQSGTDRLVLTGALRAALDRNADGLVQGTGRATNGIDLATDEVVVLSGAVSSLTDASLLSVRSAIGTLTNASAGANVLVLANNSTNTGVYLVTDSNGDGQVAATEIKLLGVLNSASTVSFTDVAFG